MLYTKKGDKGTTKTFGCDQRISKSSTITEALGALDEINSFLGVVRAQAQNASFKIKKNKIKFADIVLEIEQNLFIIQAEVAGSTLVISAEKTKRAEEIINEIEEILPPIKNFFLSGATKLSALFDFARTLARRAERRVVEVGVEGKVSVGEETLVYLNRLSSLLYALARISSYLSKAKEIKPNYK